MPAADIDSNKIIEKYNFLWHLIGFRYKNPTFLKRLYALCLSIAVTIYYPTHIIIGLLHQREPKQIFNNLIINVACLMCSVKHFLYFPQFKRMNDISRILKILDQQVLTKEDREFYEKNIQLTTERLLKLFIGSYGFVGFSSVIMWAMGEQPALMHPAWFPFDWKASKWFHIGAVAYQIFGFNVQVIQNVANDTYVPLVLCILSGHTQLLGKRLQRLGYDKNKSEKAHYKDLIECAEDYKCLKKFFLELQETISWNMLLQSVTNGVNLTFSVIFLVFYADQFYEYGFVMGMLFAISVEYYPGCYYGSSVEKSFHDLTYAMFSSDWQHRSVGFQKSLRIFAEITLHPATMYAKNTVKIHLDTYFATMRFSYSLFCVVLRLK